MNLGASDPVAIAVVAAIRNGEIARLQSLLAANPGLATAGIVDDCGVSRTLLHVVADWPGHFPNGATTVAVLVAAGAEVDAAVITAKPRLDRETPLHWAASSDDVAVLDALLDGGANIEAPGAVFTGGTPMSDAVVFAQWHAARRLLERGARTTLWQAAALGLWQRVEECCVGQPVPSTNDITNAFWHACRGGQQRTAEVLLARGANLNWIGYDRRTPLQAAQDNGAPALIAWLRSRGALSSQELEPRAVLKDLAIELANRPGALAEMGEALGRAGVSVEGGGAWVVGGQGIAHVLVADVSAARKALEAAGIRVIAERDVLVQRLKQDVPGQLGLLTRRMAEAGVNIEVLYSDHEHQLILVVDDLDRGREVSAAWSSETRPA